MFRDSQTLHQVNNFSQEEMEKQIKFLNWDSKILGYWFFDEAEKEMRFQGIQKNDLKMKIRGHLNFF